MRLLPGVVARLHPTQPPAPAAARLQVEQGGTLQHGPLVMPCPACGGDAFWLWTRPLNDTGTVYSRIDCDWCEPDAWTFTSQLARLKESA